MSTADAERLRYADLELTDELARGLPETGQGSLSIVARTTSDGTYPTTKNVMFALSPGTITGAEGEGNAAGLSFGTTKIYGLHIGSTLPPVNTVVEATYVNNRWVFLYDG